jgi:hypothetical protein
MMILLPLISMAVQPIQPAIEASSPRGAQARLAELIGTADAVHSISVRRTHAKATAIDVALDSDGTAYRITAHVNKRGEVIAITVDERGASTGELGSLSWLTPAIENATAIVRVFADEDDAVTLTTDAGDAYMIIPGRGSGGNPAVEARWAAAWDSPEA